jgi:hypothetical protein
VTEPKQTQNAKTPASIFCLPDGFSIFLTALKTKKEPELKNSGSRVRRDVEAKYA